MSSDSPFYLSDTANVCILIFEPFFHASVCFLGSAWGQWSREMKDCGKGISSPGGLLCAVSSASLTQDLGAVYLQDVNNVMSPHRKRRQNMQEVHY